MSNLTRTAGGMGEVHVPLWIKIYAVSYAAWSAARFGWRRWRAPRGRHRKLGSEDETPAQDHQARAGAIPRLSLARDVLQVTGPVSGAA
jgi:hypothetical protein